MGKPQKILRFISDAITSALLIIALLKDEYTIILLVIILLALIMRVGADITD